MRDEDDPYVLSGPQSRAFWAESIADLILDRDTEDPVVIKGGISPSGVPHLGNMNEIARGYFVAEALRDRGREVRQVFTTDDRDPLRKVPRKLADRDGTVVGLGEVNAGALGRNLGKPYTDVPDPFGCCDSYGDHFSNLIEESAERMGVPVEMVSNTELYEAGEFEDVTRTLLARREQARAVLAEYQDKVDERYVPFRPVCAECGHVVGTDAVTEVDLDAGVVRYVCGDIEAGDRVIEGCGHAGAATLREGKLPWRFEWPAQWHVLGVDFEPFGKDHAEGPWPSGVDIAREILGDEPPVPMAYEWFTLDGEAFSSSGGHVVLVHDVLEMVEPEVLRFFFTKDPGKARDFSVEHLDHLVNEFDAFEATYYGETDPGEDDRELADAAYPPTVRPTVAARFDAVGDPVLDPERDTIPVRDPEQRAVANAVVDGAFGDRVRLPYTFAAVLGMSDDPALREDIARHEDHLRDDDPDWAVALALDRVGRAREWARRTDNEFNYELKRAEMPAVGFDPATEAALDELADFVEAGHDGEAIQGEVYEAAKRHDVPVGEFFEAGYRLFFDQGQGPRLGEFLAKLDREFVVRRLRREE